MVSVGLLLEILAFVALCAAVVYLYIKVRAIPARMECLKEHVSERISAIALEVSEIKAHSEPVEADDPALEESRRKRAEAERRFNEAFASIMGYDIDVARGKKGEQ